MANPDPAVRVQALEAELREAADAYGGIYQGDIERLLLKVEAELQRLAQTCAQQTKDLAECYRQTGADPDWNEDWRLAPQAVEEVTQMRVELEGQYKRADDAEAEQAALRTALETLEADLARFLRGGHAVDIPLHARIEGWLNQLRALLPDAPKEP